MDIVLIIYLTGIKARVTRSRIKSGHKPRIVLDYTDLLKQNYFERTTWGSDMELLDTRIMTAYIPWLKWKVSLTFYFILILNIV
jgi:hypothetical protein